jgi:HKD family nuclease
MSIRYLDSRDVETFGRAISKAASRAHEANIAAAFLTMAGANQVLQLVKLLKGPRSKQQVRVLVGTWLGVTEPDALRRLRRAKGVTLRVARTPGFHVKHASFRSGTAVTAFTGSANFTAKGLGGEGELVVEVTEKLRSSTDAVERDAFRRLWADAYPDSLTDKVIAAYNKIRKPPRFLDRNGTRPGKSLLNQFGRRASKTTTPKADGSALWFPIVGTFSEATEEALEAEAGKAADVVGLASKGLFDRIKNGTRLLWQLDRRGRPKKRSLQLGRVIRELEMPTENDGRYFAVLSPVLRRIQLTKANKQTLKSLGLVRRVDSLECDPKTLRPGVRSKLALLHAMSKAALRRK